MTYNFLAPYEFATKLRIYFLENHKENFSDKEFFNLVESFQAAGGEKSQQRAFDCFSKLNKEELVIRTEKIVRLNTLARQMRALSKI
jgi:hypothetical protein